MLRTLFGSRSPSRVQDLGDCIWLTHQARIAGVINDINKRAEANSAATLVIAHFDETRQVIQSALNDASLERPATAVLARELEERIAEGARLSDDVLIDFVVVERHPLPETDDAIERFAAQLPCKVRIGRHLSLEDPLLSRFIGPSVLAVLDAMGLRPHESIESRLVSKRIRQTQLKLAKQIKSPVDSDSADLWFELNQ